VVSASASVLVGREFLAVSYQDLVNWYCSLLTRRTVYGRAAGNSPRTTTKINKWKGTWNCRNSVVALQDHCSYKTPTTNHHIKQTFVRVESLLPCEFVSALIFPFSACSLAWVVFLLGWRYSITFHERVRSIEGGCASRPEMDNDDLATSEYIGMLNLSEPWESENWKPIQLLAPVKVAANRTKPWICSRLI